jgi:antitoxin CptB
MAEPLPSIQKLQWQCRRGMLELDYIFREFLDNHYEQLDDEDKSRFVELLNHSDQDLHQWLVNKSSPADRDLLPIVEKITATNRFSD